MKVLRAIVVDDELLLAEYISRLLKNTDVEVVGCFTNPYDALEMIEKLQPDVLFLDIEMPEMNGLELAEKVYSGAADAEIIFITAYNQYAIDAFRVNALDYLLKPVIPEELKRSVERVKKRRKNSLDANVNRKDRKIRISLFGNLLIQVEDDPKPVHWITPKCAELFAYMLLQTGNKGVSKWKLIEALWPGKNPEKADINFRSTNSRLNKTLRDFETGITLVSTRSGYQLEMADVVLEVDAFELERLVLDSVEISTDNQEKIEKLLLRCDNVFLEECDGEWCEEYRETYQRYFIHLATKMLRYYEQLQEEPFKRMKLVELLLKHEPYDESIRESELALHYQIDGKKRATEAYHAYAALLKNELDTVPGDALTAFYRSLVGHDGETTK